MAFPTKLSEVELVSVSKHWRLYLIWGVLLIILGLVALSAVAYATLVSVILIGVLLTIGGFVILLDAFTWWREKWSVFLLDFILGVLYIIAGIYLIQHPVAASVTITFLLAIFYIVVGLYRVIYSLSFSLFGWQWILLSGIVSLLLGILILANWPASSLIIIGLFVGIDLIFSGIAYIMGSMSARNINKKIKQPY
jgi:uncharacterized membrane protein HdeD (DUF308 family)